MKAHLKQIRISPKKANLVAALVRKMNAKEAIGMLKFTRKRTAPVLKKLIESAVANAEHNFKQDPGTLVVKEIIVTEGPTYKRRNLISRGRAHPILKRTSHITVKLSADTGSEEAETKETAVKASKEEEATESTTEESTENTQEQPKK